MEELNRKQKQTDRENKSLNEKLEIINKARMNESGSLENKYQHALENERKIKDELEQVKNERDFKLLEYQQLVQKEREASK